MMNYSEKATQSTLFGLAITAIFLVMQSRLDVAVFSGVFAGASMRSGLFFSNIYQKADNLNDIAPTQSCLV